MNEEQHDSFEVIQIMQATGWRAVYKRNGNFEQVPLACFALVKEGNLKYVVGMVPLPDDPRAIAPSLCKDFLGYVGPGESPDRIKAAFR